MKDTKIFGLSLNYKNSFFGGVLAFLIGSACCWVPWLAILIGGATGVSSLTSGLNTISLPFLLLAGAFVTYGIIQRNNRSTPMEATLSSTITCPHCGHQKEEIMPTDACQFFYECDNCKTILKPKDQDCCVYCSYGTVPCPPIQLDKACC